MIAPDRNPNALVAIPSRREDALSALFRRVPDNGKRLRSAEVGKAAIKRTSSSANHSAALEFLHHLALAENIPASPGAEQLSLALKEE